jgi:hypothetical protein
LTSLGGVTLASSQIDNFAYVIGAAGSTQISANYTLTFPSSLGAGNGLYVIDTTNTVYGSDSVFVTQTSSLATPLSIPSGGRTLVYGNGQTFQFADNAHYAPASLEFTFNAFGAGTISSGIKGWLQVPFNCTINEYTLVANAAGSIGIDIYHGTFSGFPLSSGSAVNSSSPNIAINATNAKQQSTTYQSGASINIACTAGDILAFAVTAASVTMTVVQLSLSATKT